MKKSTPKPLLLPAFQSLIYLIAFVVPFSCEQALQESKEVSVSEFYQSELFKQAQLQQVFPDGKTLVDCTAKRPFCEILADFERQKNQLSINADQADQKLEANSSLKAFIKANFEMPYQPTNDFKSDTSRSTEEHIETLWPVLTRQPDTDNAYSSLIPLPKSYIVPGGRFREIYYWDSYFTMEGLLEDGKTELAINMLDNFSFLIDSIGFVPNGNRAYYLGRSQPPFYSLIVARLAKEDGSLLMKHLPQLEKEYAFWMDGEQTLPKGEAYKRVVKLADGTVLNRYWDNLDGPRPESFREDYELVKENQLDPKMAFKHLRAGAESGWDYSSRWFADHKNMNTIQTTDILPVDLNSLMYHLEAVLAEAYRLKGEHKANSYQQRASQRKKAIDQYLFDQESGLFSDLNFKEMKVTGVHSLAAAYPLFFKIADTQKAESTAQKLLSDFLLPGGFVTTLNPTGQQWDYPNGWAPLQFITNYGLLNYGYGKEATDAMQRWVTRNEQVYKATGKMMEKYNVADTDLLAGGGEYPLQDGFGWSNGVYLKFLSELKNEQ